MSVIAGSVNLDGRPAEHDRLGRMAAAASIFSPGEIATWSKGPAALLHAKLATTPEAANERQPLVCGELSLSFDGRIDNRGEILKLLGNIRPLDSGASDAEIVLALFEIQDTGMLSSLAGDYALAIWNDRRRRLFCARSVLGWRPLLWHCDGVRITFASQPRVLFAAGDIPRRIHEPVLGEILALRFGSPTDTLWKGICRLPPGFALEVEHGKSRVWRWYDGPFPEIELPSDEEYACFFRKLFDQALSACLRSDGHVAAHLSGGLDSSSVTCRAAELYRAGTVSKLVQPVSAVYPGEPHDESAFIRAVETHQCVTSRQVIARPYDWDWARAWSADSLHLPLRPNTSGPWIAACERLRADGVRVLLTGEGGDDWLAGSLSHWPDLLRRGRLTQLWREGRRARPQASRWRTAASIARHSFEPWISTMRGTANRRPGSGKNHPLPPWIRREWAARNDLSDRQSAGTTDLRLQSFAQRQRGARYFHAASYVSGENVIAFAAYHHIEARHPFHDRRLTEFVMGLPGRLLLEAGESKRLLRQAMKGTLPEEVRIRKDKASFEAPIVSALDAFLAETPLDRLSPVREGWLDAGELSGQLERYRSRRGEGSLMAVWLAVSLDVWMKHGVS